MADADKQRATRWTTPSMRFVGGCGCWVLLALVASSMPELRCPKYDGWQIACSTNLQQIGRALVHYARTDVDELFPPLSREPGRIMFDEGTTFVEFVPKVGVTLCPKDSEFSRFARKRMTGLGKYEIAINEGVAPATLVDDWSYFYLGYAVRNDDDMERFAAAYREYSRAETRMVKDVAAPDGTWTLCRLRDDIELHMREVAGVDPLSHPGPFPNLRSELPLLIERVGNHGQRSGANVLYLDGHVEFIKYPGKWPMTEKTVRILNELDALGERPDE